MAIEASKPEMAASPTKSGPGADPGLPLAGRGRWITWRSILLGTLAVCLVCGVAPFNDFVVTNTFFIGSYLPVALVLFFFVLIVLVNAPLHRFAPSRALRSGELATIMTMMLVSCSIPTQGLMRSFIPMLVAPFHYGSIDETFWQAFLKLDLPRWLFPVHSMGDGRYDPNVVNFYARVPDGGRYPYADWIVPLAGWGIFIFAMMATLVALSILLRYQWARNERLPFPLAQIQLALVEAPRPGKMLNDMFSQRVFWLGLLGVFIIQNLVVLGKYFPRYMPEVTLKYDLSSVLGNEPWVWLAGSIKSNTVYFTIIGVVFFIQTRVSFSLWAIFLICEAISLQQRMMQSEIPGGAWHDQHLGACVAFVAGTIWVGRKHWLKILRHTFRGRRVGEPPGDYGSYRVAFLVAVGGIVVMVAWLGFMGVQTWLACAIVAFPLLAHMVTARIVAETGLPLTRANPVVAQLYTNFSPLRFTGRDIFFAGAFTETGAFCTRESLLAYTMSGLRVNDETHPPAPARKGLIALIGWALLVGFVVAAGSSLYSYYHYALPINRNANTVLNPHGLENLPKTEIVDPLTRFSRGQFAPRKHNAPLNFAIGVVVTAGLQIASLRWSAWPLAPVGYIVSATWLIHPSWFSIFIGWLCKVLILRFGGAKLFQSARPFFVGIIFGEALAAGTWLVINLCLAWAGAAYEGVHFLPT